MAEASPYPEHDRLAAIKDVSNEIGAFLDFGLAAQHIELAQRDSNGRLWPCRASITDILAAYFDIDRDKLEREKRQMLEAMRNA